MGYLNEFQSQIASRDFTKFMQLWEEYCTSDSIDIEEILALFKAIKGSEFAKPFGQYVETFLPLWKTVTSPEDAYAIFRLMIDLQTTNSQELADHCLEELRKRYEADPEFQEKLRKVGLRSKDNFQGAISNFDLLAHIKKGNFVYHASGWGTGEIMDFSPVREQMTIEFENVSGLKSITFSNAFKTLIPLPSDHFLARRFSDPDKFEKEAKEDSIGVVKLLLKDLGPKTASEIKDELCELVIPENEWQKWWQNVRAKLKKDTTIESPENPKDPFILRKEAVSHESQFLKTLKKKLSINDLILACYNFIRDHAGKLKDAEVKQAIIEHLEGIIKNPEVTPAQLIQTYFCLDIISDTKHEKEIVEIIRSSEDLSALIEEIDIISYKKQALIAIKGHRNDWPKQFLHLLHVLPQGLLRDYLFKELLQSSHKEILEKGLDELADKPWKEPDFFHWYFSKLVNESDKSLPEKSIELQWRFSESFLVLLHRIENDPKYKELVKKMYLSLSNHRYALVRKLFEKSSIEYVKEFLLLASKCHTLGDHDLKILRSLAEVVHTDLNVSDKHKVKAEENAHTIWTTEAGYLKTQERVKQIGTTEIVDNAKEIEAARALGDLRENSEYKYALERRSRLQGEMKTLSEQLSRARIITPLDVQKGEIGIGSVVHTKNPKGEATKFTILGPWEANPDEHIFSFQSKFAQGLLGLKKDDMFKFKDQDYKIVKLDTIFDK